MNFLVFYEKKHHDCKIVNLRQKRHAENKEVIGIEDYKS